MEENNQSSNAAPPVSPVAQTPPIQTTPVLKPKSKLPILIIGIILFLLAAGIAAGFYVFKQQSSKTTVKPITTQTVQKPTPTPDPTSSWKTHEGDRFSIMYPPTWNAKDSEFSEGVESWVAVNPCGYGKECPNDPLSFASIEVSVQPNTSKVTPKEYIEKQKAQWGELFAHNYDVEVGPSLFGRETAAGHVDTAGGPFYKLRVIFDNSRIISIKCHECEKEFSNQILSTFKFTDPQQTNETSTQKLYTGNGFSFNYPSVYTPTQKGSEVYFKSESEFGSTILKSQGTPFIEPVNEGKVSVEKSLINMGDKQVNKYYVIDSNVQAVIHDIVYFNVGNMYYELNVRIDAGGLGIERFISNFKFTN